MIGLLQRVTHANVMVDGAEVGSISKGILILLGVQKSDTREQARRMAERILHYRLFDDSIGKMNHDVMQAKGGVLIVPQFTLAADTTKGRRPSFSSAADPENANILYEACVAHASNLYPKVATGSFQSHMEVNLCNDGPVTFILTT